MKGSRHAPLHNISAYSQFTWYFRCRCLQWTDETGKVHYGDKPPPGKVAKEIAPPPVPPKEVIDESRRKLEALRNQTFRRESPELLYSIENGDTARALALVREGADPNTRDGLGRTALMYAGINGQTQVIMKALLQQGANVNAKSADGTTALIATALFGDPEAIRLLLANGADANAKDREGRTALTVAQSRLKNAPADRTGFPTWQERNQFGDLTFATKKEFQEIVELLKKASEK